MTAAALGLLVTGVALIVSLAVTWVRWQVRDRRRRQARQAERAAMRDELEHERRRLRLRVVERDEAAL